MRHNFRHILRKAKVDRYNLSKTYVIVQGGNGFRMYCKNCGEELRDEAMFCGNCGCRVDSNTELNQPKVNVDSVKDGMQTIAGRALNGLSDIASQVSQALGNNQLDNTQSKEQKERHISKIDNRAYENSKEMWSWLKKDAKRQIFYMENQDTISEDEFIESVADKMQSNGVPAMVEKRKIRWDHGAEEQEGYFIKPQTSAVNPVSYMLQFNRVGKFVFVEEKSFITPPVLPEVPGKKKPLENIGLAVTLLKWGIVFAILGIALVNIFDIAGMVLVWCGIAFIIVGAVLYGNISSIKQYNKRCELQEQAWNRAWNDWQLTIFLHSFQEDINGQLSRIFDSVFGCIKQVSDEMFKGKAAIEEETSSNMNELEQIIARRKEETR